MINRLFFVFLLFLLFSTKILAEETELDTNTNIKIEQITLSKSPTTAIWRSIIFPGLGQLYCQNYWKAPIFFAGAGALWYVVVDKSIEASNLKKQLNQISDKTSSEWKNISSKHENAIDNRDIAGLYLLGVYVIAAIDAYTDAHISSFNFSNKLQFNVIPHNLNPGLQLQLKYRFIK